jgi:molybdopterin-guanine dinucleotide biosynthesis protein B
MKRIHVIGRKNSGKTTLIVALVEALKAAGVCVGTIKHTAHRHELDIPKKDSHRHRYAGARPAAIISPNLLGFYLTTETQQDPYALLEPMFADCDLVIVEGDTETAEIKFEVWRQAVTAEPLAAGGVDVQAVVTDDPLDIPSCVPIFERQRIDALVQHIRKLIESDLTANDNASP